MGVHLSTILTDYVYTYCRLCSFMFGKILNFFLTSLLGFIYYYFWILFLYAHRKMGSLIFIPWHFSFPSYLFICLANNVKSKFYMPKVS